MDNRKSSKAFAIAGAILFTLIVAPVSYFLLIYGFSYEPETSQKLAIRALFVINFPAILPLAFLDDFIPSSEALFNLLVLIMFPLNGAFWGWVFWLVWRYRQR